MNEMMDKIWQWNQPQLFSLFVTVIIIIIISLVAYYKVSKVKPHEAPKGIAFVVEAYVSGIDNNLNDVFEGKLSKSKPYLFVLATFLVVGNMLVVFGLEPIASSYSIPFILAISSWLGIFVIGGIYQKIRYLKKYLNPLEIPGAFSPLISLSLRLYGNIVGGGVIMFLIYTIFGYAWTLISPNHQWYFFSVIFTPIFHIYFDLFDTLLQCYIFTLLTSIYWLSEVSEGEKEKGTETKGVKNFLSKLKLKRKTNAIY